MAEDTEELGHRDFASYILHTALHYHSEGMLDVAEIRGCIRSCNFNGCLKHAASARYNLGRINDMYEELSKFMAREKEWSENIQSPEFRYDYFKHGGKSRPFLKERNFIEFRDLLLKVQGLIDELANELHRVEDEFDESVSIRGNCVCRKK